MKTLKELNTYYEEFQEALRNYTPRTFFGAALWCFDAPFLNAFVWHLEQGCEVPVAEYHAQCYVNWWDMDFPEDPCNVPEIRGNESIIQVRWISRSGKKYMIEIYEGRLLLSFPKDSALASSFEELLEAKKAGEPIPQVKVGYAAYVKNCPKKMGRRFRDPA